MAEKMGNRLTIALMILPALLLTSCTQSARAPHPAANAADEQASDNGMSPNAACFVCHMTFVGEPIVKIHAARDITCVKCHGLSAAHANDEHIGATKPDHYFSRDQVDALCLKCHQAHKISEKAAAAAPPEPVCTDCHGHHHIARNN